MEPGVTKPARLAFTHHAGSRGTLALSGTVASHPTSLSTGSSGFLSAEGSTDVLPQPDRQALALLPVYRIFKPRPTCPAPMSRPVHPGGTLGGVPRGRGTVTSAPALPFPWRSRAPDYPASALLPSITHTCPPSSLASALLDSPGLTYHVNFLPYICQFPSSVPCCCIDCLLS